MTIRSQRGSPFRAAAATAMQVLPRKSPVGLPRTKANSLPAPSRRLSCTLACPFGSCVLVQSACRKRTLIRGETRTSKPAPPTSASDEALVMLPFIGLATGPETPGTAVSKHRPPRHETQQRRKHDRQQQRRQLPTAVVGEHHCELITFRIGEQLGGTRARWARAGAKV